jgi:hypothetical protein
LDGGVTTAQRTTAPAPTGADRGRQVGVTIAEVFCIVGTLVGVGVIGTRVAESSGGALSADATLLAPLGPAFSIWSVVYAGLAAYTLWQWLPASSTDPRARRTGWLAAASMVLNAAWLLVTQQGWLWASVVVILALVVVLGVLVQRLADLGPAPSLVQRVVVDGTFGLYLGWVAVATCANITATLVAEGVETSTLVGELVAVLVIGVVVVVAAVVVARTGPRWSVAAAAAWGLAWIAVGRLADEPPSTLVGVVAAIAAVAVLGLTARAAVRS